MRILQTLPLLLALPAMAVDHTPPPVRQATSFTAFEAHDDEKVVIAAEPYDTPEKQAIFRVDYLSHGVMPVRLIVTNNGNRAISLRDARILFETPEGERIQAAEPEDVERLMSKNERQGKKIPLGPLPSIKLKPKAGDQAIEMDFDTFEYSAVIVPAQTTRAGFLFYDLSGLRNPLRGAKLHLRLLRDADGNELFYFEIPFDKYLDAKPKPAQ